MGNAKCWQLRKCHSRPSPIGEGCFQLRRGRAGSHSLDRTEGSWSRPPAGLGLVGVQLGIPGRQPGNTGWWSAGPGLCDSLGVGECPGTTCSSSSTATWEGRAAASRRLGAAGGGNSGSQDSLRVPRRGTGEYKSGLGLILYP